MSRGPQISVVMPVRNGEKTLRRALLTTLRALPHSSELVVVDDGSDDHTPDIALALKDPRLKYVRSDGPPGVATALNQGIKVASGVFLARMDADDLCLPGRFERQVAWISTQHVDFCFSTTLDFCPGFPWVRASLPIPLAADLVPWLLLLDNVLPHPTMFGRRDLVTELGGYRVTPAEDYDLWLRAAAAGLRMMRAGRWDVAYRIHPGQVSRHRPWHDTARKHPDLMHSMLKLAQHLQLPHPEHWAQHGPSRDVCPESQENMSFIRASMPRSSPWDKLRQSLGEFTAWGRPHHRGEER